jgi:hypothetical protein
MGSKYSHDGQQVFSIWVAIMANDKASRGRENWLLSRKLFGSFYGV